MRLTPDEEAFYREGVRRFIPAVQALSDFVDYCERCIREAAKPFDKELKALGLVTSDGKGNSWPLLSKAADAEQFGVSVKVASSGMYVEFYPSEENSAESMWMGMWLWPKDAGRRRALYEACDALRERYRVYVEHADSVYIGCYVDVNAAFPQFTDSFSEALGRTIDLLKEIDFKRQFGKSMGR
jgi:hypothetical protein